jgi:hypothetical protein
MRSRKSDKFARRYDLGFLPESWKVPLIARDQVVGAGSVGAFQEDIVVGIARDFKTPRSYDGVTVVPDELEQLLPEALADAELRGESTSLYSSRRGRDP